MSERESEAHSGVLVVDELLAEAQARRRGKKIAMPARRRKKPQAGTEARRPDCLLLEVYGKAGKMTRSMAWRIGHCSRCIRS